MEKIEICCEKLNEYLTKINELGITIGQGEISGSVDIGKTPKDEKYYLTITDGWNAIPYLEFNFCPYCGKKL